jgi:glutamyl-tRNA synthetase
MNWSVFVDDLTTGVTHSIRGKDHADNEKRQRMMFDALGKKAPEALFVGRINFEGFAVSCSKTKVKIDNGEYTGWDDIRIPFIPALRRRGYQPEVFVKYAEDVGVSLNDKTVQIKEFFKVLNHHNKELIDGKTIRRLFVANPKEVTVENDVQELMVENHPENDLGSRKVLVGDKFYVSDSISDGVYRFMHLFNFENGKMVSKEYDADLKAKIVHAVPMSGAVDVSVMMDDGTTLIGKGEKALLGLEEGSIVQFERMFFAKLDSKEDMRFVYLHG